MKLLGSNARNVKKQQTRNRVRKIRDIETGKSHFKFHRDFGYYGLVRQRGAVTKKCLLLTRAVKIAKLILLKRIAISLRR